jgi:hypothetical protein
VIKPPERLAEHGRAVWDGLLAEYPDLHDDPAALVLLSQLVVLVDRAEALAQQLAIDGELVRGPEGTKPHPCLLAELRTRSLITRLVKQIGVTDEVILPVGRHRSNGPWKARHAD